MRTFEKKEVRGLITTDIMARGLDISDITHVINFEIPEVQEQYIHRIGRTGRADKDGIAVSFVTKVEEPNLLDIEVLMNKEVVFQEFPVNVKINPIKIASEKDEVMIKRKKTRRKTGAVLTQENFRKKLEPIERSKKRFLNRNARNSLHSTFFNGYFQNRSSYSGSFRAG
jgi:superfamily II DNA/RNA helicase